MARGLGNTKFVKHPRAKHPGKYAKTKQSFNKGSDNYIKPYKGQGK
jgi:uncharacterized short protein YbdD (DUF466 family)